MKTTQEICENIGSTYKHGADTKIALETLTVPIFPLPADPANDASQRAIELWEKRVDAYVKCKTTLTEN
jgi:hypothetical protein